MAKLVALTRAKVKDKKEKFKEMEDRAGIKAWIRFYNHERTHQSLGRQTPEQV